MRRPVSWTNFGRVFRETSETLCYLESLMAIETKQDLIEHVMLARQIEMSTIPPYL
jgi:hypothetical protein